MVLCKSNSVGPGEGSIYLRLLSLFVSPLSSLQQLIFHFLPHIQLISQMYIEYWLCSWLRLQLCWTFILVWESDDKQIRYYIVINKTG